MADDFDVGYGKPPKHTQFKPGKSGNPKGRAAGTKNLKTELSEELSEKMLIKEGGNPKKVSKQRAMLKALIAKAVHGDTKASQVLLSMIAKFVDDPITAVAETELTESDKAILEKFKAKILSDHGKEAD